MARTELVFIPAPAHGHLVSMLEITKLLVDRDQNLSVKVLVMKSHFISETVACHSMSTRIQIIHLPNDEDSSSRCSMIKLVQGYKAHVRDAIAKLIQESNDDSAPWIAGLVIDMFCSPMIDVANEVGLPCYVFFTASAAFLGLMFHLQYLHDEHLKDVTEFITDHEELNFPAIVNPLPSRLLPSVATNKDSGGTFVGLFRQMRQAKGIMVNTFTELETHALRSLDEDPGVPPLYPVGPILKLQGHAAESRPDSDNIMKWLDKHPPLSVVFLCFGSMGSFGEAQVKEIAHALEQSGRRFLWSLRQPLPKGTLGFSENYGNFEDVLPQGFLGRTAGFGKVIGWAPQSQILGHPSTGGFVSHCGWNSILESTWFGVPIAAWPLYAEQQFNAFTMVVELEMAMEIKIDYRRDVWMEKNEVVKAQDIESAIESLMSASTQVREKAKRMSENGRRALEEGGSSQLKLQQFIAQVIGNME